MTRWRRWRNMYYWRRLKKWGLVYRYHTRRWNSIQFRVQYESTRRGVSIYPPCSDLHLMNLIFLMRRQLPELFFRILESFNLDIDIRRWRAIRGVKTCPDSSISASTTTMNTTSAKPTTNYKYSSTATVCSYCVDLKCLILLIVLTCSSCQVFELAKIITDQIV